MVYSSATDHSLIQNLQIDDPLAFKEIYERYWRKLTSYAIFKTNSQETAEEIVQELFLNIWEKRKTLIINHLESYLFTSIRYLVISHIRLKIANRKFTEDAPINYISTNFDDSFTVETLQHLIEQTLSKLPEKTQTVFKMSRYDELSHKEISSALDISEKTVEYHITQSLKALRITLKDYLPLLLLFHFFKNII